MRVLLVQETDWINKGPFQQNHLMEMLSLRGHQVRVIDYEIHWREQRERRVLPRRQVFDKVSRIHSEATVDVIRPGVVKMPGIDYLSLFLFHRREIERQVKEFSPDVIVGFHILSAFLSMKAAKKHNIPFLYYWVDIYHTQLSFPPLQQLAKLLERYSLQGSDKVVVLCERMKDYVIPMGSEPAKTYVIRGSADLRRFDGRAKDMKVARHLGIDSDTKVIGFVGMFHKDLGLEEVIKAMASAGRGDIKLLLVGEGDWSASNKVSELKQLAEAEHVSDNVMLTGKRPYEEVPGLMSVADILLLPAYPNAMMQDIVPIKMYEYMAMRKPVISTRLPGVMKEFGEDNGVVYVDRPEDVVAKALELVQNGTVGTIGSKARSFVERNSWDNITDEFEKILEEVIKEKQT
ncbi:glycosyltransferase family 4 protein [Dehalococcoidia bacterium]|nr:glycosyltransferase family 4 protein [Dehalococcoidia bacterium]